MLFVCAQSIARLIFILPEKMLLSSFFSLGAGTNCKYVFIADGLMVGWSDGQRFNGQRFNCLRFDGRRFDSRRFDNQRFDC